MQEKTKMTRYCPECGHVGDVSATHINCCPDGSAAFNVPEKYAQELRNGFKALIAAPQCLHQIQEPAAAEQAAWHAGLDEGRSQAAGQELKGQHSTACLYGYALARLGLTDTPQMRVLFWDAHEALQWDEKTDRYITPSAEGECGQCGHVQEPASSKAAPAAATPVVLPEPDFWVRPGATIHPDRGWQCWSNDGTATGAFHAGTVHALLATATGLPAQADAIAPSPWKSATAESPAGETNKASDELFVFFTDGSIGTGWFVRFDNGNNYWAHPDPEEDRAVAYWAYPSSFGVAELADGMTKDSSVVLAATGPDTDATYMALMCNHGRRYETLWAPVGQVPLVTSGDAEDLDGKEVRFQGNKYLLTRHEVAREKTAYQWEYDESLVFSWAKKEPSKFIIWMGGKVAITCYSNGRVEIAEGCDPNEAAKVFWECVQKYGMKLAADAAPQAQADARDAELLDFLVHEQAVVEVIEPSKNVYLAYSDGRIQAGSFPSPREAIRAAIAAQAAQGGE